MAECSVLIVDDEYYAREGVREILLSLGQYRIAGELDNSPEALAFIREHRPDIVLTDINMPGMDGIELIRQASGFAPHTKYLIITGHDKFEYAKRAFKLDIVDFILKPIDEEELASAMRRAAEMIRRDSVAMRREVLDYLRRESNAINAEHHIPWPQVRLILLQFDNLKRVQGSEAFIAAETLLRKTFCERSRGIDLLINIHINRMVCLADGAEDYQVLLNAMVIEIEQQCGINLTAVPVPPCAPGALPEAYILAKRLLGERFYQGVGTIINASMGPGITVEKSTLEKKLEAVRIAVAAGDRNEARKRLTGLYETYYAARTAKTQVFEQAMQLYLFAADGVQRQGGAAKSLEPYSPTQHSTTLDHLYKAEAAMLDLAIRLIRDERNDSEDNAVKQAIAIVGERYCEELTLEQLANEVYLNPSYLSRKLKEVLGESFVKYMTRLRMEKAVELLREGRSTAETARLVGYGNYRHFSDLFKQHTGYTPSRFMQIKE